MAPKILRPTIEVLGGLSILLGIRFRVAGLRVFRGKPYLDLDIELVELECDAFWATYSS